MNKVSANLAAILESAIKDSLNNFEADRKDSTLCDIYLSFEPENAILSIFDDVENCLLTVNLDNEQKDAGDSFEEQLVSTLKSSLNTLEQNGLFNKEFIFKPFSVSLVDEDFIVSEELLFIDDETLMLDNKLLSDLNKELDDFLKDLLKN